MRKIIIVLLALLIVANKAECEQMNSINNLLNDLQKEGYYDLIYQIKCNWGDDIAIDVCRRLVDSPHSEEIIRVYMNSCINDQKDINLNDFINKEENMNILLKRLSKNEIERFVKKYENREK